MSSSPHSQTAIVFSGAAEKITWHLGAYSALVEQGAFYHHLMGVSSGSLVAAYLAQFNVHQEKEALEGLLELFHMYKDRRLFYNPLRMDYLVRTLMLMIRYHALESSRSLERFIEEHIHADRILTSDRELYIYAYDIETRQLVEKTKKDILNAVPNHQAYLTQMLLESCSIPFVFPLIQDTLEGDFFADGSVHSYLPLQRALQLECVHHVDLVVAAPVSPPHTHHHPQTHRPGFLSMATTLFSEATQSNLKRSVFLLVAWNALALVDTLTQVVDEGLPDDTARKRLEEIRRWLPPLKQLLGCGEHPTFHPFRLIAPRSCLASSGLNGRPCGMDVFEQGREAVDSTSDAYAERCSSHQRLFQEGYDAVLLTQNPPIFEEKH